MNQDRELLQRSKLMLQAFADHGLMKPVTRSQLRDFIRQIETHLLREQIREEILAEGQKIKEPA